MHLKHINLGGFVDYALAQEEFIVDMNLQLNVEEYVRAKVELGLLDDSAFIYAFGAENICEQMRLYISRLNANPMTVRLLGEALKSAKVGDMWTLSQSVYHFKRIAIDETERANNRIAAMKELNTLMGITYTDEKGNTRRNTMGDFYEATIEAVDKMLAKVGKGQAS